MFLLIIYFIQLMILKEKPRRVDSASLSKMRLKSLKAALCFLEIPVPFTHNLDILMDRLPPQIHLNIPENIKELTEYATIRMYEEGTFELDQEDLQTAYKLAQTTFAWAKNLCKS